MDDVDATGWFVGGLSGTVREEPGGMFCGTSVRMNGQNFDHDIFRTHLRSPELVPKVFGVRVRPCFRTLHFPI